jgi:hypothetical protein
MRFAYSGASGALALVIGLGLLIGATTDEAVAAGTSRQTGSVAGSPVDSGRTSVQALRTRATKSSTRIDNTVVRVDSAGVPLDLHDGDLVAAPDGRIVLIGTRYGCGFTLNVASPWCGIGASTSRDLARWTPPTTAVEPGPWQDVCAPSAGSFGCFNAHVVRRPSDGRWIMWVNAPSIGAGDTALAGFLVFQASDPAGPYTPVPGPGPRLAVDPGDGGLEHGGADVTIDPATGTGYIAYTVIRRNAPAGQPAHTLVVEALDPSLTTGTGRHTTLIPTRGGEMPTLWPAADGWRLAWSDPPVPYGVADIATAVAPAPLGRYGPQTVLNAGSCSGQIATVTRIPTRTGSRDVLMTDRWVQPPAGPNTGVVGNQAAATLYLGPLTYADGVLQAHTCAPSWTLAPRR